MPNAEMHVSHKVNLYFILSTLKNEKKLNSGFHLYLNKD